VSTAKAEQEQWLREKASHTCSKHGGRFLPEVCVLKKEAAREDPLHHCANCMGPVSLVDGSVFVLDGQRGSPAPKKRMLPPGVRSIFKPQFPKKKESDEMKGLAELLPDVNPKADQQAIPTKVCSGCGVEKPATKEFFNTNTSCRFGVESKCKVCKKNGTPSRRDSIKPVTPPEEKPEEAKSLPAGVIIGPETLIGRVLNVRVDFTDYPQLLDCIRAIAIDEVRTPEQQIIYFCRIMLGNWKGRSDEGLSETREGSGLVAGENQRGANVKGEEA
jgi:hypothetical protein